MRLPLVAAHRESVDRRGCLRSIDGDAKRVGRTGLGRRVRCRRDIVHAVVDKLYAAARAGHEDADGDILGAGRRVALDGCLLIGQGMAAQIKPEQLFFEGQQLRILELIHIGKR